MGRERGALHVSVKRFGAALPIFGDVVLRPTFPVAELDRVRKDRLTELLQLRDEPRAIASVAFANALYGRDHRYGTPIIGTEASVRGFTRADLVAFHERVFQPGNAAIVVVGDVTASALQPQLEQAFGAGSPRSGRRRPAVPAAAQVRYTGGSGSWIPGSAQSEIRIGRIDPPRTT